MADHRQRAESILAALTESYGLNPKGRPWDRTLAVEAPNLASQMAIAHALLALGDQLDHDDELRWVAVEYANQEEPDA